MRSFFPAAAAAFFLLLALGRAKAEATTRFDPRLELIGAVDALAQTAPGASSATARLDYVGELLGRLSSHRTDPAVFAAHAASATWTLYDRERLILAATPLPELAATPAMAYASAMKAGGPTAVEGWLTGLRGFAASSGFSAALEGSLPRLDPDVALFRRKLEDEAVQAKIERYCGLTFQGRAAAILAPFQAPGALPGRLAVQEDGTVDAEIIVGPTPPKASTTTATTPEPVFWSADVPAALWNEIGQGLLESLGRLYSARLKQRVPIPARAAWACPGDWDRCLQDRIVRAVTARLIAHAQGPQAGLDYLKRGTAQADAAAVALLYRELIRYEKRRKKIPTIADEYPHLLAALPAAEAGAAPAPPALPDRQFLPPAERRRLSRFLVTLPPGSARALRALARRSVAWAAPIPGEISDPLSGPAPRSSADDLDRRGLAAFEQGRMDAALNDFQAALAAAPANIQTLLDEAAALLALKRGEDAVAACTRALDLARQDRAPGSAPLFSAEALSARASALEFVGRIDAARADLRAAVRTAPHGWPRLAETKRRLRKLSARKRR